MPLPPAKHCRVRRDHESSSPSPTPGLLRGCCVRVVVFPSAPCFCGCFPSRFRPPRRPTPPFSHPRRAVCVSPPSPSQNRPTSKTLINTTTNHITTTQNACEVGSQRRLPVPVHPGKPIASAAVDCRRRAGAHLHHRFHHLVVEATTQSPAATTIKDTTIFDRDHPFQRQQWRRSPTTNRNHPRERCGPVPAVRDRIRCQGGRRLARGPQVRLAHAAAAVGAAPQVPLLGGRQPRYQVAYEGWKA